MRTLMVTGGCGFIGSNFIHYVLESDPNLAVLNFDALTYAGNLANLAALADNPRYRFVKGDITDREAVRAGEERSRFVAAGAEPVVRDCIVIRVGNREAEQITCRQPRRERVRRMILVERIARAGTTERRAVGAVERWLFGLGFEAECLSRILGERACARQQKNEGKPPHRLDGNTRIAGGTRT